MHQGKNDEAIKEFKNIIAQYPWAQCFDPSRGGLLVGSGKIPGQY